MSENNQFSGVAEFADCGILGNIRIIQDGENRLFCGTDIAKNLGYRNPRKAIRDHAKHITKRSIGVQTGTKKDGTPAVQNVKMSFITEGDMYRLIAHSQLPEAEKFESWIFDEVIPEVAETGSYNGNKPREMTDKEILSKAFLIADKTVENMEPAEPPTEREEIEQVTLF